MNITNTVTLKILEVTVGGDMIIILKGKEKSSNLAEMNVLRRLQRSDLLIEV